MTTRGYLILASVCIAIFLAVSFYFAYGRSEAALLGLLALIPAGRSLLQRKEAEGEQKQAAADQGLAQKQRDTLDENLRKIDAETEHDVQKLEQHWGDIRKAPTTADEKEMLDYFKGPPAKEPPK